MIERIPKKRTKWIRCINPTKKDIKELAEISDVPIAEFLEAFEEDERPKVTKKEKYTEVIYRSPLKTGEDIVTQPLFFYLDKKLITIEKERDATLEKFSKEKFPKNFLYLVLDDINNRFMMRIDKIAEGVGIMEQHPTEKFASDMYDSSVVLSYFNQALLANTEVLNTLRKNDSHYAELYYDARQIMDNLNIQRDVIGDLFSLQSIMSSNRLNKYMKKITGIGLIVMIPTLIAGMYGMNFVNIPLKHHPYGFYITSMAMMVLSLIVVIMFMVADWI